MIDVIVSAARWRSRLKICFVYRRKVQESGNNKNVIGNESSF
jgi:hypothetical protein